MATTDEERPLAEAATIDDASSSQHCNLRQSRVCALSLAIVGLAVLLGGVFTSQLTLKILDDSLTDGLVVASPSSIGFKAWQSNTKPTDLPSYKKFWVYNMVNADAYMAGLEKLRVEEIGPFVYRSYYEHVNVTWSNGQMSYKTWMYYVLESSPVPVSTNITTVNIPYQLVLPGIMDYGNAAYFPYVLATKSPKSLFVNVTIDQALWGYESPIFAYIHGQNPYVSSYYTGLSAGNMSDRMTAVNSTIYDTVWTGETDPRLAQQWVRWQNNDTISLCFTPPCPPQAQTQPWATASANAVRGFTGRQYYRNTQTTDRLPFFDLYFLRVVDLVYQSSVKLFGLDLLRFIIDPAAFRNKYENPANEQYFSDGYTGVVNMTSAVARAPFLMTKPHYLDADKALFSYVDGVGPADRAAHDSYFDIEAETGAVLNGQVRVQANIRIGTVVLPDAARHTFFPNASTIVAPLYWFEDGGGIDEATADVFAKTVYLAHTVATASVWAGAIIGLALIGGGIVIAKRAADSRRAAGLPFFGLSVPPALPPSAPGSPRAGSASAQPNDSAAASLLGANSALSPSAFYQAANFSPGGRAPPGARPDSIEFK